MTHSKNRHMMWRTADGRGIKVMDMQDGHLINVINWIGDNRDSYPAHVLEVMIEEAQYRQTILFAEGRAYPQLVGNRWRLIDPKTGVGKIEKPPADYIEAVKDNVAYQRMSKRTQAKRKAEQ
jgi:hypothetical protein